MANTGLAHRAQPKGTLPFAAKNKKGDFR